MYWNKHYSLHAIAIAYSYCHSYILLCSESILTFALSIAGTAMQIDSSTEKKPAATNMLILINK